MEAANGQVLGLGQVLGCLKPIFHEQARLGESDWRKLATGSQFNRIVISASTWTTGHYCKKVKR